MRSFWRSGSGSAPTTARPSAKCCAGCCRWRRRSGGGQSIRSPTPDGTPRVNCCWTPGRKIRSRRCCACWSRGRFRLPTWPRSCRWPTRQSSRSRNADAFFLSEVTASRKFRRFLLHGVTGSGKKEVYLCAIDTVLAAGRGALLLVPEIALTPAMAGQFFARFGDRVAILHSAFSDNERAEQWRKIRSGAAGVVVGTRSGVFAPVRNLGLIVVDEEHDQSYKQEETPRYNGRDVAIVRAQAAGVCVILGSATPSLESRYNVQRGKYTLLEVPERAHLFSGRGFREGRRGAAPRISARARHASRSRHRNRQAPV